ncbi:MAG: hypothetical protein PVH36_07865 [Desulfobacterales bacterium]|jgi:hypothetical protein
MALLKCKECGGKISIKAEACPQCGAPSKKEMSKFTWLVLIFFFLILLMGYLLSLIGSPDDPNTPTIKDKLQALYLAINPGMTYDEVIKIVKNSSLPYKEHYYSKAIRIVVAFEEESLPGKYIRAEKSGDRLKMFILVDALGRTMTLKNLEYFNQRKFIALLQHVSGNYWDLKGSIDAGLYINNFKDITSIGKKKYIKVLSKEEQLKYLHSYQHKKNN